MRIQNNIPALNTHRQLGINNLNQAKSTEKLSSGFRINRAADDASGLSISEKMRAQIRGLSQASANAQDGISLIQAAEGALQESHSILQRMRELAVKAANDINETEDRNAIQSEMNQLTKEIDRIAFTTEFNKKTLLDGSLQNGNYSRVLPGTNVNGVDLTAGTYNIAGVFSASITAPASAWEQNIEISASAIKDGTISIMAGGLGEKNLSVEVKAGTLATDMARMVGDALTKRLGDAYTVTVSGTAVNVKSNTYGELGNPNMNFQVSSNGITDIQAATGVAATAGKNATVTLSSIAATKVGGATFASTTATLQYDGTYNATIAASNISVRFRLEDVSVTGTTTFTVNVGSNLALQVGANSGRDQAIKISVAALSAGELGINGIDVSNHGKAQMAIDSVEAAIQKVSKQRSDLGAVQNRLEHTVSNLDTVGENITAAESRIRDVDMAKEMMAFTKNNVLSQAATAMLAQANQAPQTVLQLLR